jgi:hypothetical protein
MARIKKNIAVSESGFVFNAQRGESFTTNPIGAHIISMLRQDCNEQQIARSITDLYEVDLATAEKDVYDFLKVLHQSNLLD